MKNKTLGIALTLLLALAVGCAGSLKANLVAAHQGIETSLAGVDDAERLACFGQLSLPANPTTCGNPLALKFGLTDQRHQKFSQLLSQAYAVQVRLAPAIKTFKAGDPIPTDLTTSLQLAQEVQSAAAVFDPSSNIPARVKTWLDELTALSKLFNGGK